MKSSALRRWILLLVTVPSVLLSVLEVSISEMAESDGIIRYESLSFFCPTCVERSDGYCEMELLGDAVRLSCVEMFKRLLQTAARTNEQTGLPTQEELLEFLQRGSTSYEDIRNALWLLNQRDATSRTLAGSVVDLYTRYPQLLNELIAEGWGNDKVWLKLWRHFTVSDPSVIHLRALLLVQHADITVERFTEDMMVVPVDDAQVLLGGVAESLRLLGASDVGELVGLGHLLRDCLPTLTMKQCLDATEMRGDMPAPEVTQAAASGSIGSGLAVESLLTLPILVYVLIACSLLLLPWFFWRNRRRSVVAIEKQSLLSVAEREELRELRRYFALSARASERELIRHYRRKARELHPDTGGDDPVEFAAMNHRYKRARVLLSRHLHAS